MVRSPSKAQITSNRSQSTLPPINDIRSPRRSVPVADTKQLTLSSNQEELFGLVPAGPSHMTPVVKREQIEPVAKHSNDPTSEALNQSPLATVEVHHAATTTSKHGKIKLKSNKAGALPKINTIHKSVLEKAQGMRLESQRLSTLSQKGVTSPSGTTKHSKAPAGTGGS